MREAIHVHPENVTEIREKLNVTTAVIARPDDFMHSHEDSVQPLIIETLHGVHLRCYSVLMSSGNFLIIYGRFDRVRGTSAQINYEITQHAINFLGIDKVVGLFVTGAIKHDVPAGTVYIPHDFVGLGSYQQTMAGQKDFRNVDMFNPFCDTLRGELVLAAAECDFPVKPEGIYACFHGYPRIETKAELSFYARNGWDVVGQTLDPEATLAREAGCHYAALAATIDDWELRARFLKNDPTAREEIDSNILTGRRRAFQIFLKAVPSIIKMTNSKCSCEVHKNHFRTRSKHFFYRPRFTYE